MVAGAPDEPLLALLEELGARGYRFTAPTPETHRRVVARAAKAMARDRRDAFGWSLPFEQSLLPPGIWAPLAASGMVAREGDLWRSRVRVASLGERLFLHSAYPTTDAEAVFFGPDSYRFASFLGLELAAASPVRHLVDLGAGSGVGAIVAAGLVQAERLTLVDTNEQALRLARVNAAHAGIGAEFIRGAGLAAVDGAVDLVIANPPFMMDEAGRSYRDGGGLLGAALSLDWAAAAARRLEPGGRMLLYTGSAIVAGADRLREELARQLPPLGCTFRYSEIDPDIFGEQLDRPGYEEVERIAAVGAVIRKAG